MGQLTETEIFDCLVTNFRLAAEDCDALAVVPFKGETYDRFRRRLGLIEGACRQTSTWREDTRWLPIGMMMAETHKRAGDWLRGVKLPDGSRIKFGNGQLHPCFVKLAENLRGLQAVAEKLRHGRTNRLGMILPEVGRAPHRDTRPVGWSAPEFVANKSGLILPSTVGAA